MSEPVPPADHPEAIWHGGYTDSQWYCVHIIALITITLGAAGSIYILVKTYKQAKMQNWKLRITQTFPACLSVADLMSVVFHGADHITQMAHGWVYQGDWCIFFGWMLVFTTLLAAFYVTTIAVYMWFMVIYLKKLNMGRYGWRMHLSCWGLSAIICSIPFALDAQPYGPSGCWCWLTNPDHFLAFNTIWVLGAIVISFVLYLHIICRIYSAERSVYRFSAGPSHQSQTADEDDRDLPVTVSAAEVSAVPRVAVIDKADKADAATVQVAASPSDTQVITIHGADSTSSLASSAKFASAPKRRVSIDLPAAASDCSSSSVRSPANGTHTGGAVTRNNSGLSSHGKAKRPRGPSSRTRRLAVQLMAFVVIYALTWTGDVVIVFMLAAGETIPFGVTLYDLTVNMSGLWNALAYRKFLIAGHGSWSAKPGNELSGSNTQTGSVRDISTLGSRPTESVDAENGDAITGSPIHAPSQRPATVDEEAVEISHDSQSTD